jgi:hypothetical protein
VQRPEPRVFRRLAGLNPDTEMWIGYSQIPIGRMDNKTYGNGGWNELLAIGSRFRR